MIYKLSIATSQKRKLLDITESVTGQVEKSKIKEGTVLVFALHTTCSVIISEVEDDLEKDILSYLETEGPKGPFIHSHGDLKAHDKLHAHESHTPAHLMSATIGQSQMIPVSQGKLLLGTWQRICLLELDGPRIRKVIVQVLR